MKESKRCGERCNGLTLKNAIVYVPSGVYLISSSVEVLFGTQLIGDVGLPLTPRVVIYADGQ